MHRSSLFTLAFATLAAACSNDPEPKVPQNGQNMPAGVPTAGPGNPGYPAGPGYPANPGAPANPAYPSGPYAGPGYGTGGAAPAPGTVPTSGSGAGAPVPGAPLPNGMPTLPGMPGSQPAGSEATPVPPMFAAAAQPALDALAAKDLPGSRADGSPIAARFSTGQVYEQAFTMQPGRCYSAIAIGIGLTQVEASIVVQAAPAPEYVAASDTGAQAVVGRNGNCFRNPLPFAMPAKLRVRDVSGEGLALAQLYAR